MAIIRGGPVRVPAAPARRQQGRLPPGRPFSQAPVNTLFRLFAGPGPGTCPGALQRQWRARADRLGYVRLIARGRALATYAWGRLARRSALQRLTKFGIVGASGVAINLAIFSALTS